MNETIEPSILETPFPEEVWCRLSRIDVEPFIEHKGDGKFSAAYLSWSNAWALLMNEFPASDWTTFTHASDETGTTVTCEVTVSDGKHALTRRMSLPVMDHRFQAVQNPNARQISDANMRCLVKCLALFGLGLDLWADTDGPVGAVNDPIDEGQVELIQSLLEKSGAEEEAFLRWLKVDDVTLIPRLKFRQAIAQLERKIQRAGK
jgi:hypothetical protein